jgi:hypothetical protein
MPKDFLKIKNRPTATATATDYDYVKGLQVNSLGNIIIGGHTKSSLFCPLVGPVNGYEYKIKSI